MSAVAVLTRRGPAVFDRVGRFGRRHPEWTAALIAVWAWGVLITLHGFHILADAPAGPVGHDLGGWIIMTMAMMIPPTLPSARHVALNSMRYRRQRAMAVFLASYLAVWAGFGLVTVPFAAGRSAVTGTGALDLAVVATLAVAAAWELTPAKRRALRACRLTSPLPPQGRRADRACIDFGFRLGQRCVTACWAMMLTMVVAGHGSLVLMALLTVIVGAEKVTVRGTRLVRPASLLLCSAAVLVGS